MFWDSDSVFSYKPPYCLSLRYPLKQPSRNIYNMPNKNYFVPWKKYPTSHSAVSVASEPWTALRSMEKP